MSRLSRMFLLLLIAAAGWAVSLETASATTIYSDTFSRVEGSGDPNGKPADPNNFSTTTSIYL